MSSSDSTVISKEPLENRDAKWIKLLKLTYINPADPSSQRRIYESAERQTRPKSSDIDSVGITAILQSKDGSPSILLQKQFRPPVGRVCIEIPAGLMDEGESAEECAVRELREETGYIGTVEEGNGGVGVVIWNDPGFCNTNLRMIRVNIDLERLENQNPKPQLEDSEFIECFTVRLTDLYAECERLESEGFAIDARVGTIAEGIELAKGWKLI